MQKKKYDSPKEYLVLKKITMKFLLGFSVTKNEKSRIRTYEVFYTIDLQSNAVDHLAIFSKKNYTIAEGI